MAKILGRRLKDTLKHVQGCTHLAGVSINQKRDDGRQLLVFRLVYQEHREQICLACVRDSMQRTDGDITFPALDGSDGGVASPNQFG